jgi:hypothetical protein
MKYCRWFVAPTLELLIVFHSGSESLGFQAAHILTALRRIVPSRSQHPHDRRSGIALTHALDADNLSARARERERRVRAV